MSEAHDRRMRTATLGQCGIGAFTAVLIVVSSVEGRYPTWCVAVGFAQIAAVALVAVAVARSERPTAWGTIALAVAVAPNLFLSATFRYASGWDVVALIACGGLVAAAAFQGVTLWSRQRRGDDPAAEPPQMGHPYRHVDQLR